MPYYVAVNKSELSIEDRFETNDTIKFDGRDTDRLVFFEVNNFQDADMATAFRNDRGEIYIEFKPIENVISDSREEVVPKVLTIQMLTTRMEEFEDKLEHTHPDLEERFSNHTHPELEERFSNHTHPELEERFSNSNHTHPEFEERLANHTHPLEPHTHPELEERLANHTHPLESHTHPDLVDQLTIEKAKNHDLQQRLTLLEHSHTALVARLEALENM
jgi:hypothetical protein